MKIVQLKRGQIEDVIALETECFAHPWTYENIEAQYNSPNSHFFVAVDDDGKAIGYIGTYMVMDECFVTNVAVTESQRKQGVGYALVEKAVDTAKSSGASFITLEVRFSNMPAINLYKKFDFISEGVRPGFYRDPDEDALIMTRRFSL